MSKSTDEQIKEYHEGLARALVLQQRLWHFQNFGEARGDLGVGTSDTKTPGYQLVRKEKK